MVTSLFLVYFQNSQAPPCIAFFLEILSSTKDPRFGSTALDRAVDAGKAGNGWEDLRSRGDEFQHFRALGVVLGIGA